MGKLQLHCDFTFEEWSLLSFEEKREIWNNYWSWHEPEKGESTRRAIIDAFCKKNPELAKSALEIGFGYFGWDVGAIYIITKGSIKVPRHFSDVLINKGTIISIVPMKTVHVKWRDVGGSNRNFKLRSHRE